MKKYILLVPGLLFLLIAAGFTMLTGPASADPDAKVYVCKYVGTPGVDEVLQTGNNPIEVSVNAIPGSDGLEAEALIGFEFADAQGRSVVIAVSAGPGGGQGDEPTIEDCPPPRGPPVCPEGTDNAGQEIPEGQTAEEFCNDVEEPPVCPEGTDNAGQEIPEGQTAEEFCNDEDEQLVCPPGTVNAGQEIPEGQTADEFCDVAGEELSACPAGSDRPGQIIPEGQTAEEFCNNDNAPPNPPNPEGEQETPPEVLGEQERAPMQPAVPAAGIPTAVDAGM